MSLEERIVRLERQNRWMKRVGGVAVVLVGLFLTLGQSKPQDEVKARKFTIVDEKGETIGVWGLHNGGPSLVMKQKGEVGTALTSTSLVFGAPDEERSMILLGVQPEGPVLHLAIKGAIKGDTPQRMEIALSHTQGAWVNLESGIGYAGMMVSPDGESKVSVKSKPMQTVAALSATKDGVGLVLNGKTGHAILGLRSLSLYGKERSCITLSTTGETDTAKLRLDGKGGAANIEIGRQGPSLWLQDSFKKETFKAP